MKFTKMHGTGNDFIVIEDLEALIDNEHELAQKLCHRNFGIGADGLLLVRKSSSAQIKMTIINADGSHANMCGNGIRCFAKYVWENKLVPGEQSIKIDTDDGIKTAYLNIEKELISEITIYMGEADFAPKKIPVLCNEEVINKKITVNGKEYIINTLLLGVPHTIILGNLTAFPVEEGKYIEKYELFPSGTNVNFCEIVDRDNIKVKTWERGAGATLACGTGSCASVVLANKVGLVGTKVFVNIPGGSLIVELKNDGIYMTGPAVTVFKGEVYI